MDYTTRGDAASGATYSQCERYRYTLWRRWDWARPRVAFIGLNPSTATESILDPTVRRCVGFAEDWGFGGLVMLNLFGFRATDPDDMKREPEPIGYGNDFHIRSLAMGCSLVVAAWGTHGAFRERAVDVRRILQGAGVTLHALRLTKHGYPAHPLYLPASLRPRVWPPNVNNLGEFFRLRRG